VRGQEDSSSKRLLTTRSKWGEREVEEESLRIRLDLEMSVSGFRDLVAEVVEERAEMMGTCDRGIARSQTMEVSLK
jgi:hypothetical protein